MYDYPYRDYRYYRYDRYYDRYPRYRDYSSINLFNSQYSNIAQNIYNTGYMDGVSQSITVNQIQNRRWW